MGGHNFYARNYRKATFMLIAGILGAFITLAPFTWLDPIRISLGGGLLFVVLCMWVLDLINLIVNTFSFRLSRWRFIDCLNTDTRATLGSKYIDKDEYKKPWIVRTINAIKESINERKAKKQAKAKATEKQETAPVAQQEPLDKVDGEIDNMKSVENNNSAQKQSSNKQKQNKKVKVVIKKNNKK